MSTLDEKVKALHPGMRVRATFYQAHCGEWTVEGVLHVGGSTRWLAVGSVAVRVDGESRSNILTDIEVLPDPLPTEPGAVIEATVTRDGASVDDVRLMLGADGYWSSDRPAQTWYGHRPEHLSNVRVILPGRAS